MDKMKRDDGMAMLVATVFIAISIVSLTVLVARMVGTSQGADAFRDYESAESGLESAIAQSQNAIESGNSGYVGVTADLNLATATAFAASVFGGANITPQVLGGVEYYAYARNWGTDAYDNNGIGGADDATEQGYYSIYAAARINTVVRRAEVILHGTDVSVWNNVIFAGDGVPPNTNLINGNVVIAGSVHLLGDHVTFGSTVIDAVDLSGTSIIRQNYGTLSSTFTDLVPAIPTRTYGGETVSTLNAIFRVKHGLVGTSGNSEIGQPNVAGGSPAVKETMDAVYVTDGYTGNHPGTVYSDNGTDNPYDLGDKVPMPMLNNTWVDPYTGATTTNPSTGSVYTHMDYFDQQLVGSAGVYPTSITLAPSTSKKSNVFYWNATTHSSTYPGSLPPSTQNYIYWDGVSQLYINGKISINGNLTLTTDATYHGRAAILVHGNIDLGAGNLMPESSTGHSSFPITNCAGFMATGDLKIGTTSQKSYCGAFYAQGTITSEKQTTCMGTFVSNWFNMGNQVPSIYQVPTLPQYLPYGMIGMRPIWALSQVSWRELGI